MPTSRHSTNVFITYNNYSHSTRTVAQKEPNDCLMSHCKSLMFFLYCKRLNSSLKTNPRYIWIQQSELRIWESNTYYLKQQFDLDREPQGCTYMVGLSRIQRNARNHFMKLLELDQNNAVWTSTLYVFIALSLSNQIRVRSKRGLGS